MINKVDTALKGNMEKVVQREVREQVEGAVKEMIQHPPSGEGLPPNVQEAITGQQAQNIFDSVLEEVGKRLPSMLKTESKRVSTQLQQDLGTKVLQQLPGVLQAALPGLLAKDLPPMVG